MVAANMSKDDEPDEPTECYICVIFGLAKFTNIAEVTVQELREKQTCLAKIFGQLELGETFGRFPFGCLKIRVVELERTVSVHDHLRTGKICANGASTYNVNV